MVGILPARHIVDDCLDRLTSGRFEELALELAKVVAPDDFVSCHRLGQNSKGETKSGWPDAYGEDLKGNIHVVEATKVKRNWKDYVRDEVKKIEAHRAEREKLATIWFFTLATRPNPRPKKAGAKKVLPETDEETKELLAGHWLTKDKVEIYWRERIVDLLLDPRCARLRLEFLSLKVDIHPFAIVTKDERRLFKGTDALSRPTLADLSEATPDQTVLMAQEYLFSRHRSLIRGQGGAGKTTVAAQIAAKWISEGRSAFYCALKGDGEAVAGGLGEILTAFGSERTLFILDDIHKDEQIARSILQMATPDGHQFGGAKILLIGREISPTGALAMGGDPLEKWRGEIVHHIPDTTTFANALRYQLAREKKLTPQLMSIEVLQRWKHIFSNDVLAFQCAVQSNPDVALDEINGGTGKLTRADALEYVDHVYLKNLRAEETNALRRLSAAAEFEFSLSIKDLGHTLPSTWIESGLVQYDSNTKLKLVHPGLGRMILEVSGPLNASEEDALSALNSDYAVALAAKLHSSDNPHIQDRPRAGRLFQSAVERVSRHSTIPPQRYMALARRMVDAATFSEADMTSIFSKNARGIADHLAMNFWTTAAGVLDRSRDPYLFAVREQLGKPPCLQKIVEQLDNLDLEQVATILRSVASIPTLAVPLQDAILGDRKILAKLQWDALHLTHNGLYALGATPMLGRVLFQDCDTKLFAEVWRKRDDFGGLDKFRTLMTALDRPDLAEAAIRAVAEGLVTRRPQATSLNYMTDLMFATEQDDKLARDLAALALRSKNLAADVGRIKRSRLPTVILQIWLHLDETAALSELARYLVGRTTGFDEILPQHTDEYLRLVGALSLVGAPTAPLNSKLDGTAISDYVKGPMARSVKASAGAIKAPDLIFLIGLRAWCTDRTPEAPDSAIWPVLKSFRPDIAQTTNEKRRRVIEDIAAWIFEMAE